MSDRDFGGRQTTLLTEELLTFRSWGIEVEVTPSKYWQDRLQRLATFDPEAATRGGLRPEEVTLEKVMLDDPVYVPGSKDVITRVSLRPVTQTKGGVWATTKEAVCLHRDNHTRDASDSALCVPVLDCTCGIYSWYRPQEARKEHTAIIVGVIANRGNIEMGDRGMRSAVASVKAIAFNDDLVDLLPIPAPLLRKVLRRETEPGGPYAGVKIYDSEDELNAVYQPDTDTLINLLGEDAIPHLLYSGNPVVKIGSQANNVAVSVGGRLSGWAKKPGQAVKKILP